MKRKTLLFIAVALTLMAISFRAGMGWQRWLHPPGEVSQLKNLYGWTDEEVQEYYESIASQGITPEQAAVFTANVAKMNRSIRKQYENDAIFTTTVSLAVLKFLEENKDEEAKTFCIDRIARYYIDSSDKNYLGGWGSEMQATTQKLRQKIEEAAEKYPALKSRLEAAQAETTAEKAPPAQ